MLAFVERFIVSGTFAHDPAFAGRHGAASARRRRAALRTASIPNTAHHEPQRLTGGEAAQIVEADFIVSSPVVAANRPPGTPLFPRNAA